MSKLENNKSSPVKILREHKDALAISLEQMDAGKTISHEEVMQELYIYILSKEQK